MRGGEREIYMFTYLRIDNPPTKREREREGGREGGRERERERERVLRTISQQRRAQSIPTPSSSPPPP